MMREVVGLVVGLVLVAAVVACALVFASNEHHLDLSKVYLALRGSMFTGFFTLGGFLLSLKTFMLVNISNGVYGKTSYKRLHLSSARKDEPLYDGLRRLSWLIHWSIFSSLITSFAQLTIGLVDQPWAEVTCLTLSATTAYLLVTCLFRLRANLNHWFDNLDDEWRDEKPKLQAEMTKPSQPT